MHGVDMRLIKALVREVRQAAGIERTPDQVMSWVSARVRRPQTFLKKVLADPDAILQISSDMRIPYLEKSPPSSEWYER